MRGPSISFTIRPAKPGDVEGIEAVEKVSFALPGERFSRRRIQYLVQGSRRVDVLVADRNGDVVGWAAGLYWLGGKVPWGRIYALATHPNARGSGIGQKLAERMIAVLVGRGARRVFLEVRADNRPAIRLYERLLFMPCRTLPNYYAPGISAIRMAVDVGPPSAVDNGSGGSTHSTAP